MVNLVKILSFTVISVTLLALSACGGAAASMQPEVTSALYKIYSFKGCLNAGPPFLSIKII